jgi:hypothetical protein
VRSREKVSTFSTEHSSCTSFPCHMATPLPSVCAPMNHIGRSSSLSVLVPNPTSLLMGLAFRMKYSCVSATKCKMLWSQANCALGLGQRQNVDKLGPDSHKVYCCDLFLTRVKSRYTSSYRAAQLILWLHHGPFISWIHITNVTNLAMFKFTRLQYSRNNL